jgi:hypothetical protein
MKFTDPFIGFNVLNVRKSLLIPINQRLTWIQWLAVAYRNVKNVVLMCVQISLCSMTIIGTLLIRMNNRLGLRSLLIKLLIASKS